MKFLLTLTITLFAIVSKAQENPCTIMKKGVFRYMGTEDPTAFFEINDTTHIEYHQKKKYHIRSNLKWIDDCNYELTMTEITVPGFPYTTGDKLQVEIIKTEDDLVYYRASVKGRSWPGIAKKIKR
jgi:hypothetical protein